MLAQRRSHYFQLTFPFKNIHFLTSFTYFPHCSPNYFLFTTFLPLFLVPLNSLSSFSESFLPPFNSPLSSPLSLLTSYLYLVSFLSSLKYSQHCCFVSPLPSIILSLSGDWLGNVLACLQNTLIHKYFLLCRHSDKPGLQGSSDYSESAVGLKDPVYRKQQESIKCFGAFKFISLRLQSLGCESFLPLKSDMIINGEWVLFFALKKLQWKPEKD